jgi:hypothetical protein
MKLNIIAASCVALLALPSFAQDATPPSAQPPSTVEQRGGAAEFTGQMSADDLMDENILNAANESIGEIEDVLIDDKGKVAAVVVEAGGFLGIGEKNVAVAFDQLKFAQDSDGDLVVTTAMTKEGLEAAPAYQKPSR